MRNAKGFVALASAIVLCPCHLPILAAALAGTAFGGLITENDGLLVPLMAGAFVVALSLGLRWIGSQQPEECSSCEIPSEANQRDRPDEQRRPEIGPILSEPTASRDGQPVGGRSWR